jgi:hypothetical protein
MYQTTIKWPYNRPNVNNIYQHLPLQDPPKFTQTGIFCLKICHLATLLSRRHERLERAEACQEVGRESDDVEAVPRRDGRPYPLEGPQRRQPEGDPPHFSVEPTLRLLNVRLLNLQLLNL